MGVLMQCVPFGILKKKKRKKSALLSTAFSLLTGEIICKRLLLLIRVGQGVCNQGARAGTCWFYYRNDPF